MKVVLDARVVEDLAAIRAWIGADSPVAAETVVSRILDGIERLGILPGIGRIGRDPDTREWVVPRLPYIIVYEVDREREVVTAVAVFHGAQDR